MERAATAKDEAAAQSAAAEQAAAKVETSFAVGSRVQIHGLKARPQKNGAIGTVQHFDPESGRYHVRLEVGNTDVALKPVNLLNAPHTQWLCPHTQIGKAVVVPNTPQLTQDPKVVANALSTSESVFVDKDGTKAKRRGALPALDMAVAARAVHRDLDQQTYSVFDLDLMIWVPCSVYLMSGRTSSAGDQCPLMCGTD